VSAARPAPRARVAAAAAAEVNAADVNGDGRLDLLVGANLADIAGHEDAGELCVHLGPSFTERHELSHPAPATTPAACWSPTSRRAV
jgi:hypothetical protein